MVDLAVVMILVLTGATALYFTHWLAYQAGFARGVEAGVHGICQHPELCNGGESHG